MSARLRCYWWWLNGNTDKVTITHDLEEMKRQGIGGALLVDANGANQDGNRNVPAGPMFGSPAWMELYLHALKEADRLDLEITLNITSGWNLGGPGVKPEQASKILTWTRTVVEGGKKIGIFLPTPPAKNGFYREIAVLGYPLHHGVALQPQSSGALLRMKSAAAETGFSMPDSDEMLQVPAGQSTDAELSEVRNLTASTRDGKLSWDAPAGTWEILRIGYTDSDARVSTASGAWQGLAIDYLSQRAFDSYWKQSVAPLLEVAKGHPSLRYLATDSWELGGTNWTEDFAVEFKQRRGYDPVAWLPAVAGRVLNTPLETTEFLADMRHTVADLITERHYDVFAARAAIYGLGVQAESGGPHGAPIDALETYRHSAIPQTEFWSINPHRSRDSERFFTKEAASAANIYGKRWVAQEGETSIGPQWSESLATDLKPSFDMAVTEGMNRLIWHEFTSSPEATGWPGQEYFAGTHLNPKITWWPQANSFFLYLNRVQFLMQQGVPVNDVLYLQGGGIPAFVRLKSDDPAHVLPGYDYDVTNEDAWLRTIRFEKAAIVGPSGVRWRLLAMPKSGRLSLAALQKVERYVHDGGSVVGVRPLSPAGRITRKDASRFAEIADRLWKQCPIASPAQRSYPYGNGTVFCTGSAHEALMEMNIPQDVSVANPAILSASSSSNLDYAHRRTADADIYFLRNGSGKGAIYDVTFRAKAIFPELWNPVEGIKTRAAISMAKDLKVEGRSVSNLHIALPAYGSTFVVFPHTQTEPIKKELTEIRVEPVVAMNAWSLSFQKDRGGPAGNVIVDLFKSWTDYRDPKIRYFSGTVTYSAQVKSPIHATDEAVYLKFEQLHEIATVVVNGHEAGTVWASPYEVRVDPWLQASKNRVEMRVTNLWPNRIIGDLQPSESKPITHTNISTYRASSPLLTSGILGNPVWSIRH